MGHDNVYFHDFFLCVGCTGHLLLLMQLSHSSCLCPQRKYVPHVMLLTVT